MKTVKVLVIQKLLLTNWNAQYGNLRNENKQLLNSYYLQGNQVIVISIFNNLLEVTSCKLFISPACLLSWPQFQQPWLVMWIVFPYLDAKLFLSCFFLLLTTIFTASSKLGHSLQIIGRLELFEVVLTLQFCLQINWLAEESNLWKHQKRCYRHFHQYNRT